MKRILMSCILSLFLLFSSFTSVYALESDYLNSSSSIGSVKKVIAGDGNTFVIDDQNVLWGWGYKSYIIQNGNDDVEQYVPIKIAENVQDFSIAPQSQFALLL